MPTTKKKDLLTPGGINPKSTQAVEVDSRGRPQSDGEVTLVKNKRTPPTSKPGNKYKPVDDTKRRSKR